MSLNVAYNQNINKGIDTNALRGITQEIFKRAETKSVNLSNLDLTKFKKADLGMDLYNGKVDSTIARQVAMTNSGMQINLNENVMASVKFLNNQASKSIFKNVEGRMAIAVNEEATKTKNTFELAKFNTLIKTLDMGKDKNGSNPFHKGELLKIDKKEKEESINIFA